VPLRILGIGEVLWDLLPSGAQLGGAPANFAYHASALGAEACIVSRVGTDARGDEILRRLHEMGLNTACLQFDAVRPTGTVTVAVDALGQPCFDIHADVAWDALEADVGAYGAAASADAVCFGTLAQRSAQSRTAIRDLVAATPSEALRILDVNLRQQYYTRAIIEESLALATVLKVNDTELPRLATMLSLTGDIHAQIDQLLERWQLRAVAYTRGEFGSLLRTTQGWSDHPGIPTRVVDTVGAGDSFTAAMALGLLKGWALDDVNTHANRLASFVASHAGGTPVLPAAMREAFAGAD
jgi:fructokinase